MDDLVGTVAGKIWHYLHENGESDILKIKLNLKINNTQLFLALGWLSRENKININQDKNTYLISLKE